jgi:D-glycerate 3-kinase
MRFSPARCPATGSHDRFVETLWPQPLPLPQDQLAEIANRLQAAFAARLEELRIEPQLVEPAFRRVYLPLAAWVAWRKGTGTLILGINGAQGTGKSTLCEFLRLILETGFGLRVAGFSLDDLYKTRAEREILARTVHPLLRTRGVPGTHDVALGLATLDRLYRAGPADRVAIPSFDKAQDDRRPRTLWPRVTGPFDVIVLEGWCVGARPEPEAALEPPLNDLEAAEDPNGAWRRHVNGQLAGDYAALFGRLDALIMLKAPNMARVFEWRCLQEEKLGARRLMDAAAIRRFVRHYERITRRMLEEMPGRADVTLFVDDSHQICKIRLNPPA